MRKYLILSLVALTLAPACGSGTDTSEGGSGTGASAAVGGQVGSGGDVSATGGSESGGATGSGGSASGGAPGGAAAGGDGTGGTASGGAASGGTAPTLPEPDGFAQMEALNRGVVAVPSGSGVFVSWRLFGYDPADIAFNVYRGETRLNESPITDSTNYFDAAGTASATYSVRPVLEGVELEASETARVWNSGNSGGVHYLAIPTEAPPGGMTPANEAFTYTSSDASVGDVDGDGQYELIVKWDPSNSKDNSQDGYTGPVYIDAYRLSGERLWRINLGVNIRAGAHYTQMVVYDLDGDGKAELVVKTAPGTRDGTGTFLRLGPAATDNDSADYRNSAGRILTGPEYLTVFSGETGAELATTTFEVGRGTLTSWGNNEGYGNRVDRFLATVAFVDESGRPSVIMGRGMYARTTFTAWNWRDGQLTRAWLRDYPNDSPFAGKGAHSISVANVDDDPMQEIINGGATFDHDGRGMCAVPFYAHGDALHVTDLVPSRPGLEVFMPYESSGVPAYAMRDARTCQILWQGPNSSGEGPGRGVAGDVDPSSPGAEAWVNSSQILRGANGQAYGNRPEFSNFLIWWDGDLSRELLDANRIRQYDGQGGILTADGCTANNGTKSTPTLSGDIIGDWREEVLFRCGNQIRIYTTNELTTHRIYTLMHDPQYRVAISWQNVEYNQPPHPSFHIGEGMAPVPTPDIHVR